MAKSRFPKRALLDVWQGSECIQYLFTPEPGVVDQSDIIITCLLSDDHTRVILSTIENEVGSTYINGNFIDVRNAISVDMQPKFNVHKTFVLSTRHFNPLSTNFICRLLPTNCLSVFDHFVTWLRNNSKNCMQVL